MTERLYREIISFCAENQDAALVAKYSRYFKEGYDAWGLTTELLHGKANEILEREKPPFEGLWPLCRKLVTGTKYEEPSFAIVFFKKMARHFSDESFREIESWFEAGISNWAHCDAICSELLKPHLKKKIIRLDHLAPWRFSDRLFKKRASLVAAIYAMKEGAAPAEILFHAEPLMHSKDRPVQQAAGWLLRETWKLHPAPVEEFLLKHKDTAPRLIYQYATEKMTAAEKERFRKTR